MRHAERKPAPCRPETLYARLGGEPGIGRLVDRIYHWMQVLPEASDVLAMHHADLGEVKARLRAFLSGWLGGPERFRASYGEPRMRRRHFAFVIDNAARDGWMLCLRRAVDEEVEDPQLGAELKAAFQAMADHLRNTASSRDPRPRPDCGHGARAAHPHHGACQA